MRINLPIVKLIARDWKINVSIANLIARRLFILTFFTVVQYLQQVIKRSLT